MTHGHCSPRSRTYISWQHMKDRCCNPQSDNYVNYGGQGVKVCDAWMVFENFLHDMGERPRGKSLDRIDPHGDYTPENCRWATKFQQGRNQRRHH